ncbi:demethylmenaquinone methyltransferase [Frankia torreyi]|uniref:Demethylmenaquinone methyltransferase n=1 Tax=Frankia torreyi TaxID=1856 RepID=A0A0D8BGL1_9ACTN|nr:MULTISPECIES: demethylmenaquinone methyltransferase [Frankia]KJE23261.1 demethylmenaquinone methyltransferase [Frankia torreyi]KQC39448.1 demethylmenaquinone methyltransferase [Frankia sp. ACN1ag]KQM06564.1 demethylmenaquinone methyltransferase [Frankia sp. CpI1-P]
MGRAGLDKRPQEVAAMFDGVAGRYDLTNAVLSGGLDRTWRRATAAFLDLRPGLRVLDLAAGTATSSRAFAEAGAQVVACDFSLGMLRAGQRRLAERPPPASPAGRVVLTAGDGLHLPFPDAVFDRTTISFGLRNVADTVRCLAELRRVTRPGGALVVCEFSRPVWGPWRTVYLEYLMRALPRVARTVSSSPDSYVYLAESIRAWPAQAELADLLREAGWSRVTWRNLTGGVVALHRGHAPG